MHAAGELAVFRGMSAQLLYEICHACQRRAGMGTRPPFLPRALAPVSFAVAGHACERIPAAIVAEGALDLNRAPRGGNSKGLEKHKN